MKQEHGKNFLPPTNEDTCGPYFPIYFRDESLEYLTRVDPGVVAAASGQNIILRGRALDRHGNLANGIIMEFWQANSKGVYRSPAYEGHQEIDPWFNGYGRLRSALGEYSFRTIMPGAVGERAPDITVTIFSDGINRIVTQVFFADQEANANDPVLLSLDNEDRTRLTARHDGRTADGAEVYLLDIVMAGDNETPFSDDSESCKEGARMIKFGRQIGIGPTDNTSDQHTPRVRLVPARYATRSNEWDLTRISPSRPRAEGVPIEVTGTLRNEGGRALPNAQIETWNANHHGRYRHVEDHSGLQLDENFFGTGHVLTDDEGNYRFWTTNPGAYLARPDIGRWRPEHIHLSISGDNTHSLSRDIGRPT